MNRDLKRSLQRKQHHQQQQETRVPMAMDFTKMIERQRIKKALDHGISMGWMAALNTFERTLEQTSGIGPKRREAILAQLNDVYAEIKKEYGQK